MREPRTQKWDERAQKREPVQGEKVGDDQVAGQHEGVLLEVVGREVLVLHEGPGRDAQVLQQAGKQAGTQACRQASR